MTLKLILAANVKRLRLAKSWSQMDLAHHSGVKQRTISSIENAAHNTGIENLESLGKAFDLPSWALLLANFGIPLTSPPHSPTESPQ
jgi:transcriptional regulator with XRE-family HTH domain